MRTISLDARCSSPASADIGELRTPSPSQCSLASIATGSTSNMSISSPKLPPGAMAGAICIAGAGGGGGGGGNGRCLSPLLIPPRVQPGIDPTMGPASPLGALQPDLYRVQDGPIYLTAPESSPALGRLHLRVKYDYHLFDLTVHLIEGAIARSMKIYKDHELRIS